MMNKMAARDLSYKLYRIAKLWQIKSRKVENNAKLLFFKPGLWRTDFFGCGKEWYHFQQELMVNKTVV